MAWLKDVIDVFQALLTPTIAVAGIAIARRQWKISDEKLRLDLFERRWKVFEAVGCFLSEILKPSVPIKEAQVAYMKQPAVRYLIRISRETNANQAFASGNVIFNSNTSSPSSR